MPITPLIFTNAQVFLCSGSSDPMGGVELSAALTQVRLTRTYDQHDVTVMGMTDHATALGLGKWSAACTVLADFLSGSSGLDATVFSKIGPNQTNWLFVRPVRAARTPSNPEYYGQVNIADYNPMDGKVGDPLLTPLTFVGAGSLLRNSTCSS